MKWKTVAPIIDDIHIVGRLYQIAEGISYASTNLQQNLSDLIVIPAWVDNEESFLEDLIEDINFNVNRIIDNANKIEEALPDED